MSGEEIAIFERLAEHELRLNDIGPDGCRWDCACGEWGRAIGPEPSRGARSAHRAHLADVLAPLVEQAKREGAVEFAHWVATHRAHNGSDHDRGQSLYNECINAVLPTWATEWTAERAQGAAGGGADG